MALPGMHPAEQVPPPSLADAPITASTIMSLLARIRALEQEVAALKRN